MLFLLFQLGPDRYALEATRVVEVVPLVELKPLPRAPAGLAGIFNYRGHPVPAVDLCTLTLGRPASEHLSTRIVIINYSDETGTNHLLGLIAENATCMLRTDSREFVDPGIMISRSTHLGPILMDSDGPIQWVHEHRLLPEPVGKLLFSELAAAGHEPN
jgi:chemotaxis-related protein WspB